MQIDNVSLNNDDDINTVDNEVPTTSLRRTNPNRRVPVYLQDFQTNKNHVTA